MPQMAPLYWLMLFFFFLLVLTLFIMMNYFIKPFEKKDYTMKKSIPTFKIWSL
uniref:ATP synthase F0 subunit 8 n=1 Tax=Austruca iranica TaxID=578236 RepID=UPI0030E1E3A8